MVYYLGHVIHICAEPYKSCTAQEHVVYYLGYISAQNPMKDVLRRNMVGHVVHICAEPYKSCTAQEHGVLPGPRGTYLRRIHKRCTYYAGTWCTTWATWYISAQNSIKAVLRRNMAYYLGHVVHICAESHKRCTYYAGTWCTTWATWYISAQNPIEDVRTTQEHGLLPGPRGTYLRSGTYLRRIP
jgi:hypothetical protein